MKNSKLKNKQKAKLKNMMKSTEKEKGSLVK